MFYDERIEAVKGKLCHNSLLIAMIFSLLYGAIRITNYIVNTNRVLFSTVILEILIAGGSAILLSVGFILRKCSFSDERTLKIRLRYYQSASKWLIGITLITYALVLPYNELLRSPFNLSDADFSSVLTVLSLLIGTYAVYTFRREDICFNYSLMESNNYPVGVLKNIGKLTLLIAGMLSLSIVSLTLSRPIQASQTDVAKTLFIKYTAMLLSLAVIYLVYSFLERESYHRRGFFSASVLITLILTILLRAVLTAITYYIMKLSVSSAVAISLITLQASLGTVTQYTLLIFLTYFHYEYRQQSENRLLRIAVNTVLLTVALSTAIGQLLGGITNLFVPILINADQSHLISRMIGSVNMTLVITKSALQGVAIVLGLIALCHDKKLHRAHFVSLGILVLLAAVGIFLSTQTDASAMHLYENAIELSLLVYFAVLIFLINKKHAPTE